MLGTETGSPVEAAGQVVTEGHFSAAVNAIGEAVRTTASETSVSGTPGVVAKLVG
jgi:hypothetical protein